MKKCHNSFVKGELCFLQQVISSTTVLIFDILCQPLCSCLQSLLLCKVEVGKSALNNVTVVKMDCKDRLQTWPSLLGIHAIFINLHQNWYTSSLLLDQSLRISFKLLNTIFSSYIRGTIVLYADANPLILYAESAESATENLGSAELKWSVILGGVILQHPPTTAPDCSQYCTCLLTR